MPTVKELENKKLQLSSDYWQSKRMEDKINVFQNFLLLASNVQKKQQNGHTSFSVRGNHLTFNILFCDNTSDLTSLIDNQIFTLVFYSNENLVIENINNNLCFLFEKDCDSIISGLYFEELVIYKVFYHFIKKNNLLVADYDKEEINRFYQNFSNSKIIFQILK